MFGLGTGELLIIAAVILVLFGARRIPELGSSLAKGIKNFQKGLTEKKNDELDRPKDKEQQHS